MSRSTPPPRPRIGSQVIRLATVSSTNDYAKQLARAGQPHGTVVMADEQTCGRGQRGRRWASPPGGLWVSVLLRPSSVSKAEVGLLNTAAAVAAAEAVAAVCGVDVGLKWPNDLILGGCKLGGVLVETAGRGGAVAWAVAGIGINVNNPPEALPVSLRKMATSLRHELGRAVGVKALLHEICARLEAFLALLEAGDGGEVISAWRRLDVSGGRAVRMLRTGRLLGAAVGIDADGSLLVRASGGALTTLRTSVGVVIE
jgi:BirA family biotin operon repressor/biotin-[acetyl-CoA-carboxylase] ligase